jgi:hypothetical protein
LFYIEALGFGRALGALDLNTTKLEKRLFMLNPYLLTAEQSEKIKAKFAPLLDREIFPLMEELELADRREFDTTVFEAFGIEDYRDKVINSLKHLYNIRISVKNNSISA